MNNPRNGEEDFMPEDDMKDDMDAGEHEEQMQDAPANESGNDPRNDEGAPVDATALAEGLRDQLLRAHAEMQNVRKRAEREKQDAARYGISQFARDIVAVADNLHRALAAVPQESFGQAPEEIRNLIAGVGVTERELLSVLEKHGVKRIEPLGEKFDPHFHQAMFEVPNANQPDGTIVQVVQNGYLIGERLLRPALVGVAKG